MIMVGVAVASHTCGTVVMICISIVALLLLRLWIVCCRMWVVKTMTVTVGPLCYRWVFHVLRIWNKCEILLFMPTQWIVLISQYWFRPLWADFYVTMFLNPLHHTIYMKSSTRKWQVPVSPGDKFYTGKGWQDMSML